MIKYDTEIEFVNNDNQQMSLTVFDAWGKMRNEFIEHENEGCEYMQRTYNMNEHDAKRAYNNVLQYALEYYSII